MRCRRPARDSCCARAMSAPWWRRFGTNEAFLVEFSRTARPRRANATGWACSIRPRSRWSVGRRREELRGAGPGLGAEAAAVRDDVSNARNQESACEAGRRGHADPQGRQPRPCPRARCTPSWAPTARASPRWPMCWPAATDYEVTDGDILWNGESMLDMAPDERAAKGVFLAFQYPHGDPRRRHHDLPAHGRQRACARSAARRSSPRPSS